MYVNFEYPLLVYVKLIDYAALKKLSIFSKSSVIALIRALGTGGARCHGTPVYSEEPNRSIGLLHKSEVGIMNLSLLKESSFLEN